MLISHTERPRELKWYHAGPMLFGDWGTSRFYVLGLAMFYSLHASFYYVLGVCALVAAVGWAYTIICRCYPDGGGVYSAARHTSKMLAVVGALLLFADYIITASLSAMDAMHYFGLRDETSVFSIGGASHSPVILVAIVAIMAIGVINFIGPKKAGTFALVVAIGTLVLTMMLVASTFFPHAASGGATPISAGAAAVHRPTGSVGHQWLMLVNVVLALSGVEAIANMTGIMVPPVAKTSKKAIWPVLVEVVVFNIILAIAMNALPNLGSIPYANYKEAGEIKAAHADWETNPAIRAKVEALVPPGSPELSPEQESYLKDVRDKVLRVMGELYIGKWFGAIAGIVFGLLLISAVNTAVADMISIQYVMARDGELPRWFTRLNLFGVPWAALIPAIGLPVAILAIPAFQDLDKLADLYAIGVVGAIAINLGSCTTNLAMPLKKWERAGMGLLAAIMVAIEITLAYQKPHALVFAAIVLGVGLGLRFVTKQLPELRAKAKAAPTAEALTSGTYRGVQTGAAGPVGEADMPKVLVAARGSKRLLEFAAQYTKHTQAVMYVLYVRQLNLMMTGAADAPALEEDAEAQRVFAMAREAGAAMGVPVVPIYATGGDVAFTILDFAATYNVAAVLMGVSRQGAILRALRGDVLSAVADHLPEDIPLLIHA